MNRFTEVLSDAASRLHVSEPTRSRVLLEVAADMEGLFEAYLERGVTPEEARDAVLEQFDLSDEVLGELASVHDSPLQRSLETLSGQLRAPWARALLALVALSVVLLSGRLLITPGLYEDAGPLVWALVPFLGLGLGVGVWKSVGLFPTGLGWTPARKKGLGYLLGLAFLQLALAGAGLWVELYLSALRIRMAPRESLIHLVGWVHRASATLVVALSGALLLGFIWFFLSVRAQRLEEAAAARLMEANS